MAQLKGLRPSSTIAPQPRGVVAPLRQRATTPLGLADTTRFSQGSSRLATLGFGSESLWDSRIIPKGIGSIPSGIGARTFLSARLLSATERTVPRAGNPQAELRASFGLRPSDFGLRQSQRDCVLQPRVAESARLPWVSVLGHPFITTFLCDLCGYINCRI